MRSKRIFPLALALAFLSPPAFSQPPQTLSFQGKLGDASGNPLTGTYSFEFCLYGGASGSSSPCGGSAFCETWDSGSGGAVSVTNGIYSVNIGTRTIGGVPAACFTEALYLEVTVASGTSIAVGPEILSPRVSLAEAPYAFEALNAESVNGTVSAANGGTGSDLSSVGLPGAIPFFVSGGSMSVINQGINTQVLTWSSTGPVWSPNLGGAAAILNGTNTWTAPQTWMDSGTFNAQVLLQNSSMTLTGANGYIQVSSDVHAAAFFGDGSGLTNIPVSSTSLAAILNDTNTWTAPQTWMASGTFNSSLLLQNSSLTLTGSDGYIQISSNITMSGSGILTSSGVAAISGQPWVTISSSLFVSGSITGDASGLTNIPWNGLTSIPGSPCTTGDFVTNIAAGTCSPIPYEISVSTIDAYSLNKLGGIIITTSTFLTGQLGIGTTTPAYTLDVYGNVHSTGVFFGNGSGLTNVSASTAALSGSTITWTAQQTFDDLINISSSIANNNYSALEFTDSNTVALGNLTVDGVLFGNGSGLTNLPPPGAAGSPGQITYNGGPNEAGAAQFYYNASSGSVGIGISTPIASLEISSPTSSGTSFLLLIDTGTGSEEKILSVLADGNVGVNNTNPGATLHIGSPNLAADGTLIIQQNTPWMDLRDNTSGGKVYRITNGGVTAAALSIQDITDSTTPLTLDSSGNLGLGTTGPGQKLDIQNGGLSVSSYTSAGSSLYVSPTNGQVGIGTSSPSQQLDIQNGGLSVSSSTIAGTSLFVSSTTGDVGIHYNTPTQALEVGGNAMIHGTYLYLFGATSGPFLYGDATNMELQLGTGNGSLQLRENSGIIQAAISVAGDSYFNGGNVGIATQTPSGLFTVANGTMTVLSSGLVGIDRSDPAYALDINGDIRASGFLALSSSATVEDSNALDAYVATLGTGSASNQQILYVSTTGMVGVDNGYPAYTLDVNGDIHASGNISAGGIFSGNGSGLTNLPASGSNTQFQYNNAGAFAGAPNLVYVSGNVGVATAAPAGLFTVGNGTMTALSNGNVGIGTASPAYQLDISSYTRINGAVFVGAQTDAWLKANTCPPPCFALNSTDNDLYTSTGTAAGQWRNTRTSSGP